MRDGNSKQDTSDRGSATRKRRERDRMRDEGFKLVQYWVHADDVARVKKLAMRLRVARTGIEEES
jgi:SPX domain protein involved in polyphosphate accumulation